MANKLERVVLNMRAPATSIDLVFSSKLEYKEMLLIFEGVDKAVRLLADGTWVLLEDFKVKEGRTKP